MSHLADFGPKKTSMMARLLGRKKSGGAAEGELPMEQKMEQKDLTIARLMEEMSAVAAQNLGLGLTLAEGHGACSPKIWHH